MHFSILEHAKCEEKKAYLLCYPVQELVEIQPPPLEIRKKQLLISALSTEAIFMT